jgi:hypothetical protein
MKRLLTATAVLEVGAGLALVAFPSPAAMFFIGAPLTTPAALMVARVGATGLLALGVACWLARGEAFNGAARALVAGMLLYNAGVGFVVANAAIGLQPVRVAMWAVVVLHAAMAGWCIRLLVPR